MRYNKDRFADEYECYEQMGWIKKPGGAANKSITAEKLGIKTGGHPLEQHPARRGAPDKTARPSCIMPFFAQVATKGKTAVFDGRIWLSRGRAGLGFVTGNTMPSGAPGWTSCLPSL